MGVDSWIGLIGSINDFTINKDNDAVDRLSCSYSVLLLVAASFGLSIYQFTGQPVHCWAPKHFEGGWETYANSYCWVKNTYYLPFENEIPKEGVEEGRQYIKYYQWIAFILVGQAIFFYAPSMVWNGLNQQAGVDADDILEYAHSLNENNSFGPNRKLKIKAIAYHFRRFLGSDAVLSDAEEMHHKKSKFSTKRFGCYLVVLYLITKCLYLTNVIAQLFILNSILSVQYSVYGIEVLGWMLHDYDWTNSPQVAFPRVTMCDFKVRRLGNIHRYTVQCTLPINLYTEKIYMFLWFWMVFVATCTAISLVTWLGRVFSANDRITYVKNHLKMIEKPKKEADIVHSHEQDPEEREKKITRFVRNYLRQDGVFLLRLIGHNTNTITVTEIIGALWENWSENDKNKKQKEIEDDENKKTTDPLLPK